MFQRVNDSDGRYRRMCVAYRKTVRPFSRLLGWDVFLCDGKAYLFRKGSNVCRIACWFDLCHACRLLGLTAYRKGT